MNKYDFTHKTDELRKLILENPELPLVVFAGQEAGESDWSSTLLEKVHHFIRG